MRVVNKDCAEGRKEVGRTMRMAEMASQNRHFHSQSSSFHMLAIQEYPGVCWASP